MLSESHRQQVVVHRMAHYSMMTCFLRPKASHLQQTLDREIAIEWWMGSVVYYSMKPVWTDQ